MQNIKLPDGNSIPQVGLGLWKVTDETDFVQAFNVALAAGYRHFDSAQHYGNESMLGRAITESGLSREDIFITTKIKPDNFGYRRALESVESSLTNLRTEYIDLLLLHFPVTFLRKKSWKALEDLKAVGRARSIGVSNYTIRHLKEMELYGNEPPAVNQVELHIFLQQPELIEYCQEHNISIEAYSPLAHAHAMDEPVIREIAKKHDKSYAQIMLRWCIEHDLIVLPKSVTPTRIQENIKIFDFRLDEADMQQLAQLDKGLRTTWDPTNVP